MSSYSLSCRLLQRLGGASARSQPCPLPATIRECVGLRFSPVPNEDLPIRSPPWLCARTARSPIICNVSDLYAEECAVDCLPCPPAHHRGNEMTPCMSRSLSNSSVRCPGRMSDPLPAHGSRRSKRWDCRRCRSEEVGPMKLTAQHSPASGGDGSSAGGLHSAPGQPPGPEWHVYPALEPRPGAQLLQCATSCCLPFSPLLRCSLPYRLVGTWDQSRTVQHHCTPLTTS